MDLDALRLFVEVVRRGGFAAVARDRGLDPSSVSRTVAALEKELGVRLLQRTTRRLAPTEAGEIYLRRVEALADELDHARDEALALGDGPAGTLRMTCSVAFGCRRLTPLLGELRAAFPALKLELLMTDANLDLIAERVDLAIRLGRSVEADVIAVKLFDTRYRVCVSPDYLKRAPSLRVPADLKDHRCILFALPEFRTRWLFRDADGAVSEVPIQGDLVISNALALRDCAAAGLGPALLPDWLIDEDIAQGRLIDVFPDLRAAATGFETAAWLLYPSRAFLPYKVRAAIVFLRKAMSR